MQQSSAVFTYSETIFHAVYSQKNSVLPSQLALSSRHAQRLRLPLHQSHRSAICCSQRARCRIVAELHLDNPYIATIDLPCVRYRAQGPHPLSHLLSILGKQHQFTWVLLSYIGIIYQIIPEIMRTTTAPNSHPTFVEISRCHRLFLLLQAKVW